MASQHVSRRTMELAVLLVVALAAFEARAQPPIDGPPPLPAPPLPGLPPLPGPPMDGTPGGLFPPPGPPAAPGPGMSPSRAPGWPVGPGGGPGPGLNPTATGLLEKLELTLTYFNAFWMFAALSLGLVLLVLLVLLMKLMKRSVAEPGEHVGVSRRLTDSSKAR